MNPERGSEVVLSAADIARIARVRRPAVSNWRRRFADFPAPVAGTASHPLFAWDDVEQWCARHGKTFLPSEADRLWQRAEAAVGGAHILEFLAHVGIELAGVHPPDTLPAPPPQWLPLLRSAAEADHVGAVLPELLARFDETWARQADEPPFGLAELVVRLAGVDAGATVADPACGTGRFAQAAADAGAGRLLLQDREAARGCVAQARLLVAGHRAELAVADALAAPASSAGQADAVVCAPGGRDSAWDPAGATADARWIHGLPPEGEADLAWVQHALSLLRPGGRAVLRLGTATASRRSGRRLRANLLRAGAVQAVLRTPEEVDQGADLWILRRPRPGEPVPQRLLFVCGAGESARLLDAWEVYRRADPAAHPPEPGPWATAVPAAEVLASDAELSPEVWVTSQADTVLECDLRQARDRLDAALADLRRRLPRLVLAGRPADGGSIADLVGAGRVLLLRAPSGEDAPGAPVIESRDVVVPQRGRGRPHPAGREEVGDAPEAGTLLIRILDDALDPEFLAGVVAASGGRRRSGSTRSGIRSVALPALAPDQQRSYREVTGAIAETERRIAEVTELGRQWTELAQRSLQAATVTLENPPDAQ